MEFLFQMDSLTSLSLVVTVKFDEDTDPTSLQLRAGLDVQGNSNGKVDTAEAEKFEKLIEDSVSESIGGSQEGSAGGLKLDGKDYEDVEEDPTADSSGLRGSSISSKEPVLVRVTIATRLDGSPASGSNHELTVEDEDDDGGGEEGAGGKVTIRIPPDFKITSVTGDLHKASDCEATASDMNDVDEFAVAFTASKGSCVKGSSGDKDDGGFLPGAGSVAFLVALAVVGLGVRRGRRA